MESYQPQPKDNNQIKNYKIYKIVNSDGRAYIGSTCNSSIKLRFSSHKSQAKYGRNTTSCRDFDFEKATIELLASFWSNTRQAHQIERSFIDSNECVNIARPFITEEERLKISQSWLTDPNGGAELITCGCGSKFLRREKARHDKCKKHLAWLVNLSSQNQDLDTDLELVYSNSL